MRRILFVIALNLPALLPAQETRTKYDINPDVKEHQLGDWRNFATQTHVTVQLNPFTRLPNSVGSQFLFEDWVSGKVVTNDGVEFTNGLYNFNKMSQSLFVQMKDTSANIAFQVDKSQVKSIFLSSGKKTYTLEKLPALDPNSFYISLAKGAKYSLYSQVKTRFVVSNYFTNGIVTNGNSYDEYKDESSYYVLSPDGKPQAIQLSKKSIKKAFAAEKDRLDQFYKDHAGEEQNEDFLIRLVISLNRGVAA